MLQKFVILLANGAQQLSCGSDLVDGNHALHNKGRARPRAFGGHYAREPSIRKGVTVPGRSQSVESKCIKDCRISLVLAAVGDDRGSLPVLAFLLIRVDEVWIALKGGTTI